MFPISDSIKTARFPIVNVFIIGLTIFIFFQQIISPYPDIFIQQYSLIPSLVNFTDFSTLTPFVTAIFLHGGFLHILSNMWFLWIFGDNVEERFGFFLFPFIYLMSGIAGNLVQYFLMPGSPIPMIGASGAVAGILGAYYVFFPEAKIKSIVPIFFLPAILDIPAPIMLGYWFILQVISGASSLPFLTADSGGIAFFAHVGGFLTGVYFAKKLKGDS